MSISNSDLEVITMASDWLQAGHSVQLVTVVNTWGSSPRPVGSIAAVRDDGVLVGSVSGGCVEKQLAEKVTTEHPDFKPTNPGVHTVVHRINDEQAQRFGLACGGELELVFEQLSTADALLELASQLSQRIRVCRFTNVQSGESTLQPVTDNGTAAFKFDGEQLTKIYGPQWRVLIVGAGQLSRYCAEFALALDCEVIVCEPRPGFQEAWQVECTLLTDMSPDDAVLKYATDSNSAVLALTHDPNVDDLAVLEALPSNAFYVGALGSRANNQRRCKRLRGLGLEHKDTDRLKGPVGLDIGSRTSAEIAISIVAQLVQLQRSVVPNTKS